MLILDKISSLGKCTRGIDKIKLSWFLSKWYLHEKHLTLMKSKVVLFEHNADYVY